ncbi:MAG TPA: type II secretion system protein GspF [Gammaproteobacteria bacterium]|nr:type II secretion system protein GspF [Gammaproteobacteria bacterium]
MGAFEFTALDDKGKERKGVLEGDAPRQIRQQLRDKGWVPVSVAEISQEQQDRGRRLFELGRGVSATDLALITRQFATLVRSGLPIEEALRAVSQQCEKTRLKNLLLAVRSRVMEGHPLATALADYPRVFSDLYRATIAAGEQSGHLDEVLDRLADYTENRQVLRDKIVQALIYPILVIVVAILVVAGLMTYVVPQIIQVFENMGQELPPLTVGLIAVSDFTRESGPWIAALLVAAFIGLRLLLRRDGPKKRFHRMLLAIPLLRHLVRGLNAARFARTLSILSASGVPVLESLRISAQVVTNLPMQEAVDTAARHVREGASLSRALDRSGYFPPMTIHLIASGESSGKLELMLERAAASQERELESLMQTLLGLFGPLVILVMGGIVLVIILAMLLPIINLNQLVI